MEAKELRIGSLVIYEGMISVVTEITCTDVVLDHPAYELEIQASVFDLKPVLLNEEGLFKFGFEKDDYDPSYDLLGFNVTLYEGDYMYNPISEYFPEYGIVINYEHELQNLYFAIKGKDLTTSS